MKWSDLFKKKVEKAKEDNTSSAIELPQEDVKNMEKILNWILPGCQLLYRDTDEDTDPIIILKVFHQKNNFFLKM